MIPGDRSGAESRARRQRRQPPMHTAGLPQRAFHTAVSMNWVSVFSGCPYYESPTTWRLYYIGPLILKTPIN